MTGEELRKKRKRLGWTLKEMGENTGYTLMHIWKMEKGYKDVSPRMLKILKFLKK